MLLRYFYDRKLAHASYLVGCQRTGEALVVDPSRIITPYVEEAAREGLRIVGVAETHIHADFASGGRELAHHTGATLYLSDEGDAAWKYVELEGLAHRLLKDGDSWMIGNLQLQAMHTPGHTPEHLCYLLTDTAAADAPMGLFSGDFVFVGDVGRPDLLESAAGQVGTARPGAQRLFQSLQRFRELPDYLQLWPAHGAGSACGKALGAVPSSTVGYEKRFNWALAIEDEETFVQTVLAGQPEPPAYFAVMKQLNKKGAPLLRLDLPAKEVDENEFTNLMSRGWQAVDIRPVDAYAQGFIPGTLNIPYNDSFLQWAGALLNYRKSMVVIAPEEVVGAVSEDMARIGFDRLDCYFPVEGLPVWEKAWGRLHTVPQVDADGLAELLAGGEAVVLDVRRASEYEAGHMPGVANLPLTRLPQRLGEIPRDRPVVLSCQSGNRSSIAASLLRAAGVREVINMRGGFVAWQKAGKEVVVEGQAENG